MAKNSVEYKEVLFPDSLENYISIESITIYQFLPCFLIDDVAKPVELTFYTNKNWHFKVQCFWYDKTISPLTEEEATMRFF